MSVTNSRRFTARSLPCSEQRIAQHCCAAGFQSGLCLLGVRFSHSGDVRSMYALVHFADSSRTSLEVLEVPEAAVSNRGKDSYSITSSASAKSFGEN